ncbi:hypothetical protein K6664_19655 [Escherichia ruysiae]|uniref:hypothetical protein n=1 Tax=Escherichia TaxID=561 RepID=UPI0013000C5D|nr:MULTISPECIES: hypothetical protein [Escherichia]MBS5153520.1 hypothetical protein [Escherichia coli]MBY7186546.1 hypothetical protein [Escherichia ruysiae]MBY7309585.1 hypothetical protein [Escherichia ruysiae]MBY7363671.1 hypothetical protein [Escherichia coli]
MLCGVTLLFADAIKVTPRLVLGVNIAFLVQDDGHAAAKPSAMQAAARHVKGAGNQQGMSQPFSQ